MDHTFLFIGGLHGSGTSILHRCLREHPDICGFRDTGVPEDEGQHLQTVLPPAHQLGGPGRFAMHPSARLDQDSELASAANARRLWTEWSRYWDTSKPVLLEKSPPNLLRTRLLQAWFPRSAFVLVMRHPVAVSYSTKGRGRKTLASLLEHWVAAQQIAREDAAHLDRVISVRYEEFVANPAGVLAAVCDLVGLDPVEPPPGIRDDANLKHFRRWQRYRQGVLTRRQAARLIEETEDQVEAFGYSLDVPE